MASLALKWSSVFCKLGGCGFKSHDSQLSFRYHACFEQGVSCHPGIYTLWIHSEGVYMLHAWLTPVLESPGIFLWSNSPKERLPSKHQDFLGFCCMSNLAVHWLTAVIFIWGILDAIMSIYSQHITRWQYSNLQLRA